MTPAFDKAYRCGLSDTAHHAHLARKTSSYRTDQRRTEAKFSSKVKKQCFAKKFTSENILLYNINIHQHLMNRDSSLNIH